MKRRERQILDEPIVVRLPDYKCTHTVLAFERVRNGNNGRLLTLAIATWKRDGMRVSGNMISDIVTMMRLADVCSGLHSFPVNAEKLYGVRGRMAEVGSARDD